MAFGPFTQNPNILILMTDQQRAFRNFPETWITKNLPNFTRLQRNGMTFTNAICNASRCSPSRSVLYTGQYTWQTTVFEVGGTLPVTIPTIGKLMATAGYQMVYKGKWHLTGNGVQENVNGEEKTLHFAAAAQKRPIDTSEAALENEYLSTNYGLDAWTSPDAGNAEVENGMEPQSIPVAPDSESSPFFTIGGSLIENDDRFVIGTGAATSGNSAIDFLTSYQQSGSTQPFCLAVSLVNPHDISVLPSSVENMKYNDARTTWQAYEGFSLPESFSDTLAEKPQVQQEYLQTTNNSMPFNAGGPTQLEYLQFYAYLHTLPDALFNELLGCMSEKLLNNTIIIRLADHGEMGMAHGGMRFKDLNAYNETINVPLVFSNPVLFPKAQVVQQLVGLVDLLPTLATITGLTDEQKQEFDFKGMDFSSVLLDPEAPTQSSMLYTYDDLSGYSVPRFIRTLVMADYKFCVYYNTVDNTPTGTVDGSSFQYELYDLISDPNEITNLLPLKGTPTPGALKLQKQFYDDLTKKMKDTQTTPNGWPSAIQSA